MKIWKLKDEFVPVGVVAEGVETLPMYVISDEADADFYTDDSSITNWCKMLDLGLCTRYVARTHISEIYDDMQQQSPALGWQDLSNEEKVILAKHYLVPSNLRLEVLSQDELDMYNYFKIYDYLSEDAVIKYGYMDPLVTPKSVDYKKDLDRRLHPKYVFDSLGFLVSCTYYKDLSITQNQLGFTVYTYSDPVLKYEASYYIKPDGYVGYRTVTRRWYRMDDSLDPDSKITVKYYEPMTARDEGKTRRRNLINELLIQVVGLLIMTSNDLPNVAAAETDAIPFMKSITNGISDYYEYGSKLDAQGNPCLLVQQIISSNYSRLNNFVPNTGNTVTIRMFIISRLSV